jgi:hypothetical protein
MQISPGPAEFVRIAGAPVGYTIEQKLDERRVDHFKILVRAENFETLEIALNTFSLRSFNAGFDGRIRLGVLSSNWSALPPAGVSRSGGINYSVVEANNQIVYRELERSMLESVLIQKLERALFVEAWGEFYMRVHPGIHQIHSRRASCAVSAGYAERDGAVRFYFRRDFLTELLLFKFCGQA